MLSVEERSRYERYLHPRAKSQFARCRAALRAVLAGYLGCEPEQVRFDTLPDGKPTLAGKFGPSGLEFNVSHTDGIGLIAVASSPVGIDVETARPVETADALVGRFFAPPEREQYHRLPADDREAGFLKGWACKEAVLKGVGCGARGLEGCLVDVDPREPARVVGLSGPAAALGTRWGLGWWQPRKGVAAALAVRSVDRVEVVL